MRPRVLIAGIGNLFLGDAGFGVEVARRLSECDLPEEAQIANHGISGMHLAFDLLGGYDTTILIDAAPRGEDPGTVSVSEVTAERRRGGESAAALPDAHGMQPEAVLELLDMFGGDAGQVLVVCCEPLDTAQHIGLSDPVARAVEPALQKVLNEVAKAANISVVVDEAEVPVRTEVRGASELLGIDPLYAACEGRIVVVVAPDQSDSALELMRARPQGNDSAVIGRAGEGPPGSVLLNTTFGGTRIVGPLVGDLLPRIC